LAYRVQAVSFRRFLDLGEAKALSWCWAWAVPTMPGFERLQGTPTRFLAHAKEVLRVSEARGEEDKVAFEQLAIPRLPRLIYLAGSTW
jgi:hypothetical protein